MNKLTRHFIRIKISYGVTVCNEAMELDRLLFAILAWKSSKDEIIVLQDVTKPDARVEEVLGKYRDKVRVFRFKLNGDFSAFKNRLISVAKGDYLFQFDADEIPKESLIKGVKRELKKYYKCDCFLIPRINLVNGITPEHLLKWNLKMGDDGRLNFPDYQPRLFRLNGSILWKNKVHEELSGYKRIQPLPIDDDNLCILHIKDIERQTRQNDFYDTF